MIILQLIILTSLTIISFTLVDLNLTLLNWQPYLSLQSQLTQLGYYNRPINGNILLVLCLALVANFLVFTINAAKLSWRQIKFLALATVLILLPSYSMFSYDFFNYMFDARIMTLHHQNPYTSTALQFPQDEWTRFMHWTHRTYPYGPSWLLITTIPSILGFTKFLPTFIMFKILFGLSFLFATLAIHKIICELTPDDRLKKFSIVLFITNPLLLIDGLISPHLDLVMGALGLWGVYYAIRSQSSNKLKSSIISVLLILSSAGVKFATAPWILVSNKIFINHFGYRALTFSIILLSIIMAIAQAVHLSQYQPWYGILIAMTLPLVTPYIRMKYLFLAGILLALPIWIYINYAYIGVMVNPILP